MKKGIVSFIMAVIMMLTSIPVQVEAATGTPELYFRFADLDGNGGYTENMDGLSSAMIGAGVNTVTNMTLYYDDGTGITTKIPAKDVSATSSDASIFTCAPHAANSDILVLNYHAVGDAKLNCVINGTNYSMDINVISGNASGGGTTTPGSGGTTPGGGTTTPGSGGTTPGGSTTTPTAPISLQFQFARDDGDNKFTPNGSMQTNLYTALGNEFFLFLYLVDTTQATPQNLSAGVSMTDSSVATIEWLPNASNVARLKVLKTGSTQIQYVYNNVTYTIPVQVNIPNIGFYSSTAGGESNFLSEYTVTDSSNNEIYLVADNGTLSNVDLSISNLGNIATCTSVDSSGKFATIKITGTPENRNYNLKATYTGNGGANSYDVYAQIKLINGKSSLQYKWAFRNNDDSYIMDGRLQNTIGMSKGYSSDIYPIFVSAGVEQQLLPSAIVSSDPSIVKVSANPDDANIVTLEALKVGVAEIQYTYNGKVYSFTASVGLPELAYYSQPVADEQYLINDFAVADLNTPIYLVANGVTLDSAVLNTDFDDFADITVNGNVATIQFTAAPPNNMRYGVQLSYTMPNESQPNNSNKWIGLSNAMPGIKRLAYCWPDFNGNANHGPFVYSHDTAKWYATDVWMYLTDGTTETMVDFADLSSSDTSVVEIIDPGYGDGMVKLKTNGWGNATISCTVNGETYTMDVVSGLQDVGYYSQNSVSKDNWIQSFVVTKTSDTYYLIADNGFTFTNVRPSAELSAIANISTNAANNVVTIQITGTPQDNAPYGFEIEFQDANGNQMSGGQYLQSLTKEGLGFKDAVWNGSAWEMDRDFRNELIIHRDSSFLVYPVFKNDTEQLVAASSITSSNPSVVQVSAYPDDTDLLKIEALDFGNATIQYNYNGEIYSFDVSVELPTVGYYTTNTASQSSYITEFDAATGNTFYMVPKSGKLLSVTPDSMLSNIADVTIDPVNGAYATITIKDASGIQNGVYYQIDAEYTLSGNAADQTSGGASIRLNNSNNSGGTGTNPMAPISLQFQFAMSDGNGSFVPNGNMQTGLNAVLGDESLICLYIVDNGQATPVPLTAGVSLTDPGMATIGYLTANSDVTIFKPLKTGSTEINYVYNNVTYSIPVQINIPNIGFYSTSTGGEANFLSSFTVTENNNTIYLVAENGTLSNIDLSVSDLGNIASCTAIDSSGKFATITVTGTPNNKNYSLKATYTAAGDTNGTDIYARVELKNGMLPLSYRMAMKVNGTWQTSSMMGLGSGSMDTVIGSLFNLYPLVVNNGVEQKIAASQLSSSDPSVVKVSVHLEDPNIAVLEGLSIGSANIQYVENGITYNLVMNIGLPKVGFYTQPVADVQYLVSDFTVADLDTPLYLVTSGATLNTAEMNADFDRIADLTISGDSTYATIVFTNAPQQNVRYEVQTSFTVTGASRPNNSRISISLTNAMPSVGFRWPGMDADGYPIEDKNQPLQNELYIEKGQNSPSYFYFVQNGQETKLSLADLKSSDESIVKPAVYEGSDAIVLETGKCGQANIEYTLNGKKYLFPVTVELPILGCYTANTATESAFVKEFYVSADDNQLYIVPANGYKISAISTDIATAVVASDGSYATVTFQGTIEDETYFNYDAMLEDSEGALVRSGGWITLYNGNTRLAYCWPDEESASGHAPFIDSYETAKGDENDVWLYVTDGRTETRVAFAELTSSDSSVVEIIDPGYGNGMVTLRTVDWGNATISCTVGGETYTMDVVSGLPGFGFFSQNSATKANWIRSFTVTSTEKTFYFMITDSVTVDEIILSPDLEDIATISANADKTVVTITITGTPEEDKDYGVGYVYTDGDGEQGENGNYINLRVPVQVGVGDLPVVDTSVPVTNVTAGVDPSQSEEVLATTTQNIVDTLKEAVAGGTGNDVANTITIVTPEFAEAVKEAIENEDTLDIITTIVTASLTDEQVQNNPTLREESGKIREEIQKVFANGQVAQLVDLKVVADAVVNGVQAASSTISDLGSTNSVRFTMALTEELQNTPDGYDREFAVFYVHNGQVHQAKNVRRSADGKSVAFDAYQFSTYALTYQDTAVAGGTTPTPTPTPQEPSPAPQEPAPTPQVNAGVSPATGDNSGITFYVVMLALAAVLITGLLITKRKSK